MGKVDGRAGSALSNFLSPPCFSVTMGLFWDSSSLTSERRQFLGRGNILQSKVSSQCPTTPSFHCLIPEAGSWTLRKVGPSLTTRLVRTPPRRLERSNQDPIILSFLGP